MEDVLIDAARRGDERAFQQLVALHRDSLRAHGYRFLGNLADADDAVQDALVNAWQGIAGFEGRSSFRSWLFTIATHAALRIAARRRHASFVTSILREGGGTGVAGPIRTSPSDPRAPLPEPLTDVPWLEPFPAPPAALASVPSAEALYSEAESIEFAFVAALQWLPPNQRAALILRDVLGFSARETADVLDTSVASANSALQRARDTLAAQHSSAGTQAANRRALGEEAHRQLLEDLLAAWQRADTNALVALLAKDATFTMPPLPCWFRGRDDIGVFFAERVFALRWRFVAATANGQPSIAAYQWSEESKTYRFEVLNVIDLCGDRISAIYSFLDVGAGLAQRFGLPDSIDSIQD